MNLSNLSFEDYMLEFQQLNLKRAAIPFSAFADAVEEYEAGSETDDEGDMLE